MKKLFILLFALPLIFVSCDDALELTPFNSLTTEEALQEPGDFEAALQGAYTSFVRSDGYYGGQYWIRPDILGDNLILNQNGRQTNRTFFNYDYSGDATWGSLLDGAYRAIYRANIVLEQAERLEDGDFKNNLRGEALAIRGQAHFDVARVFAGIPTSASGSDLGIVYKTSSDVGERPARISVSETYARIIADMEEARDLVNEANPRGRFNRAGVAALLSRIYLYNGDYDAAEEAATFAIDNGPDITPGSDLAAYFTDAIDGGAFFRGRITAQDGTQLGVVYSQTGPDGIRSEYVPFCEFYAEYSLDDARRDAYFVEAPFAGADYVHVAKYFVGQEGTANLVDAKIIRAAEVYLNRAEARFRQGDESGALEDLNALRDERYSSYSGNESGQSLLDEILRQRRLELAFEGHRFFDIKRLGNAVERPNSGDFADCSGTPADIQLLPAGDFRFNLPYPQSDLNTNPNLEQNPGY